jgi:hypothetical protein
MGQQRCRLAGPRMGVEGVPRPGRGIGGDERVSGTMCRAVAAERDKWPGFSRHAFAPFRRCLIFSSVPCTPGECSLHSNTGHIEEMLLCAAKLGAVQDPS